jgi:hypothetical protein
MASCHSDTPRKRKMKQIGATHTHESIGHDHKGAGQGRTKGPKAWAAVGDALLSTVHGCASFSVWHNRAQDTDAIMASRLSMGVEESRK